jgi:hypothetical protein
MARNNRNRRFGEYISFSQEEVMPSFPIDVTDSQRQPVDVAQLYEDERLALSVGIKEEIFQMGARDPNLALGDEWSVKYDRVAGKFMLKDVPDNKVDVVRNMAEIELKDYGGAFDGETHYAKVVVPPGGGRRRRKTRKPRRKSRLTRRR